MNKRILYNTPANMLKSFVSQKFGTLRIVVIEDQVWFVGKDVATALGYGDDGKSATNAVARHVDSEDKGVTKIVTPGGKQNITIINESGLYSLVLSSKLPSAKEFKRWVTHDVLPSIRQFGLYATPETLEKMILSTTSRDNHEVLGVNDAILVINSSERKLCNIYNITYINLFNITTRKEGIRNNIFNSITKWRNAKGYDTITEGD